MLKLLSYNVQSPYLPSDPGTVVPEHERYEWVLHALTQALAREPFVPTVVCLQEVCSAWVQRFTATFGAYGYSAVAHNYAPEKRQPLHTMILFHTATFSARPLPLRYTNIPTSEQWTALNLTREDMMRNFSKQNAVLGVMLTVRHTRQQFVVGTYHAPCLFKTQPRAHVMHICNALAFVSDMTQWFPRVPVILAGDFNMLPTDEAYRCSSAVDVMRALFPMHTPTNCSPEFVGCLDYVFCNRHALPVSMALHAFKCVPKLSRDQPSDHALLSAVISPAC